MRCGGGGRASPPAPQRDPAPSCPDAVTKVTGEIVFPHPRQRPKVPQRPSQGPHLAQGQEKMSGKRLEIPFVAAWLPYRPQERRSASSLLPLCLSNSLSRRHWPHPLLQHEVIASQSQRARRRYQALIGCMKRLCLSPFRLPSAPSRCGARRRKPPFRRKTPETRAGITMKF